MSILLNSYATRAYSEHPTALWPLDDDAYYISLISPTDRLAANWTKTNCTFVDISSIDSGIEPSPFEDTDWHSFTVDSTSQIVKTISNAVGSGVYVTYTTTTNHNLYPGQNVTISGVDPAPFNLTNVKIISTPTLRKFTVYSELMNPYISGGSVTSTTKTLEIVSPNIFRLDQLNETLGSFCLNLYLYQNSFRANYYEIGYSYYDTDFDRQNVILEKITASTVKEWVNFNVTYPTSQYDSNTVKLIIRVNVDLVEPSGQNFNFILSGLSVGQWSEPTCSKSLGCNPINYASLNSPVPEIVGAMYVPSDQYGILADNAYYIVKENKLLAQNQSLPIIFGTDSCTRIESVSSNIPSFIFPSKGMLNESGRYKKYSFEMWLKIEPNTLNSRRILGPIDNDYGVYVRDGFISLVIGEEIASHAISEWYRPMLMHIIINSDTISLLINSETVATIVYDRKTINLSNENEWWGIYSYEDIHAFQVDCLSVYPYIVPNEVAKKRFVWGIGTESLQFIDNKFSGSTASIDFSSSEYSANMIYPDVARWDAGYYNNAVATKDSLSLPDYKLPTTYLGGRSIEEWYASNYALNLLEYPSGDHPRFITFRPNTVLSDNWDETSYLLFESLNILTNTLSAVYGVFEISESILEDRPLMYFVNVANKQYFKIQINGTTLSYYLNENQIYSETINIDEHFSVGINFQKISEEYGYDILTFFSALSQIQLLVGGDGTSTFEGKIYNVSFCDQDNFSFFSDHFQYNGITAAADDEVFMNNIASYTLTPIERYNRFFLDISVSSNWEEYYPLSYFASYAKDKSGNIYYDLDYLQINLGYESVYEYSSKIIDNLNWTYYQLFNNYNTPVYKDYEILDNEYITKYQSYADLEENIVTEFYINTDGSSLKSYITFQLISEGANEPLENFIYSKDLPDNRVIDAGAENTNLNPYNAYYTKFEFTNGTIVYPPKTINLSDIAIVVHFVINQKGILSSPFKVKDFEITSKTLSDAYFNHIGTRFGIPLTPYVKEDLYYNSKTKNPLLIYKKTTPYIYTTQHSGIKILNNWTVEKEHAISMPINSSQTDDYSIGAMQLWMMYDLRSFPQNNMPIFEIDHKNGTIEFVISPDVSGLRGKIHARNKATKVEVTNIQYYQNGIAMHYPIIRFDEWHVLGFSFDDELDFSLYPGSINIFGGTLFNNISYYLPQGLGKTKSSVYRLWSKVANDPTIEVVAPHDIEWAYWKEDNPVGLKWRNVYVSKEDIKYINGPKEIYLSQVGVNADIVDDNHGVIISNDTFRSYSDTVWSQYSIVPI
jgi:hypothetical protein